MFTHRLAAACVATCLALAGASGAAWAQGCLSQGEARTAVQNGEAISLSQVRGSLPGDVVSAQLCRGGGGLVYIVNVLGAGGRVERLQIDARSGAIAGR